MDDLEFARMALDRLEKQLSGSDADVAITED